MSVTFELTIESDQDGWYVRLTSTAGHLLESKRFDNYDDAAAKREQIEAVYHALPDLTDEAIDRVEKFANETP